ncbi:hypothetical protein AAHE18_20G161600 [Arachis hypogaea]
MLIGGEPTGALEEKATNFDFDLFVIGASSGGIRASRLCANFGAKITGRDASR